VKDMSNALYKGEQEFASQKHRAEILLVKEQKAMADSSPEGIAKASTYAAREQEVVQKMEEESIVESKLKGVKHKDLKIQKWIHQHQEHGAVPYDVPPLPPMIESREQLQAPDAAPLLAPAGGFP
jgi:hypothetical protein